MKKLKLMTIVGTRPELIRLSEIIKKADIYFEHIFVHTGQNYSDRLNDIFYQDLGLRMPDYYLDVVGEHLGETLGNIISRSYELMDRVKPDALLILGDTNSALSAISAKRLKIPIFHMEAGNRCFDENLPEETNRRIVDHIADIHLPYTEHARRYLISEGVQKEHIYVTGSPMKEIIMAHDSKINKSRILDELKLEKNKYIVLSAHREENIDHEEHFTGLMNAINKMAETYGIPVIYSVHPRSAALIEKRNVKFHSLVRGMPPFSFTDYSQLMRNAYCVVSDSGTMPEESAISKFPRNVKFHSLVRGMPPFSFTDYSQLMRNAYCVVSDSGTMPEESAISKFPAVCIRTSTERPEALDKGGFIIGGIEEESILQSIDMAVKMGTNSSKVPDYEVEDVSRTVIRIIQSYTRIIDDKVWRK